MFRRWHFPTGLVAAVAGLFLAAGPAEAQVRPIFYFPVGSSASPYSNPYTWGNSFPSTYYYQYDNVTPNYGWAGYGSYNTTVPQYVFVQGGMWNSLSPLTYPSSRAGARYGSLRSRGNGKAATPVGLDAEAPASVNVKVPDGKAEVWFGGLKTRQTGKFREFVTPSLRSDETYRYDVKAQWTEDGRAVTRTQSIHVRPGREVTVDFTNPAPAEDAEK